MNSVIFALSKLEEVMLKARPLKSFCVLQTAALLFSACWLFTNIVVLNLVIALVLEHFRLKDRAKLGIQRKEVLKAARSTHVSLYQTFDTLGF